MAPSSKNLFRNTAIKSGLVSGKDIVDAEKALREGGPPATLVQIDDDALARQLVKMEVLTQYQADQIKTGRSKMQLGPYIIVDFIGQGGMGQVFKAVHEVMGREAAVKVLPRSKSTPEAIASFTREIRTQAKLDHRHLVRAHDAGHDGNVYYLAVEYVPGTDLRRLVRTQGPLTMQQAAQVISQAAEGLQYAHQTGLIHRDVKPGNILVTPQGLAKVSDLGLAGFMHDEDDDPRAGKTVGTADYLAPEQIRTPGEITAASDIYSLGCTLYYAVTGKVPFPGGGTGDKIRRHCNDTPWHPRRFNADLSEEFVEVIADMMEKDPKTRIQSAAEVIQRLEAWTREVSDLPSQRMTKSPWSAAPVPSGDEDHLHETSDHPGESPSHVSQRTDSVGAQVTKAVKAAPPRRNTPPPLPDTGLSKQFLVLLTGAIVAPVSALFGGLLVLLAMWLFK